MSPRRVLLTLVVAVLALSMAQDPHFERFRERWRHLPEPERVQREERLRELMRLDPSEREALLERVRAMRAVEDQALEAAPQDMRRRFREAPPWERDRMHREYFEGFARERGRDLREKLPPDFCNRERGGWRGHHPFPDPRPEMIRHLGERLGLSEAEVTAIEALEPEARRARLFRLEIERLVRERGLPPTLEEADWNALLALDDEGFLEGVRKHFRRGRPGRDGGPPPPWWDRDRHRGGPPEGPRPDGKRRSPRPKRDGSDL